VILAAASEINPLTVGSLFVALISVTVAVLAFLSSRSKDVAASLVKVVGDIVAESIAPVNSRLSVLETKIDVFWRNVAFDAAQILHSPHVRRARVDALLEKFQLSYLTGEESAELLHLLAVIRGGYEPEDSSIPVALGERFAAGVIERVIELMTGGVARLPVSALRDVLQSVADELNLGVFLFRYSPDALVVTDGNGKILLINDEADAISGYNQDELKGQPIEMLVPADLRASHVAEREEYMTHPHVRDMGKRKTDLWLLHKNGTKIPVWIKLAPAQSAAGKICIIAAIRPRER
jgi:PAS domain S-box-containing protein